MRNALAIARKELSIYFTTPLAYFVIMGVLLFSSVFFIGLLQQFVQIQEWARTYTWERIPNEYRNLTDGVILQLWGTVTLLVVLAGPLLTMGLFAKERRERTLELLMTLPVRPWEIVIGKYLGGLGITSVSIGSTLVFPLILAAFGSSESGKALEWQTVFLGYAGLVLLGGVAVAVTMLVSSFTDSELLAGFIAFILMIVWLVLQIVGQSAEEPYRSVLAYISFQTHLSQMMKGVVELKSLVMFASGIAFCLFLTHRKIESERWA